MTRALQKALVLTIVLTSLAACGSTDRVDFVTATSIGIDGDTRTMNASIGYHRFEGVIGPAYPNGALPPVAAALNSDLEIFNPSVSQVYATGDAARLVVRGSPKTPNLPLEAKGGAKRIMVFGTGTTLGLKLGFGTAGPESILFGYKRIEYSSLPIGNKDDNDVYGSVLASIDLDVDGDLIGDSGVRLAQLFASGDAADTLASNPNVQTLFLGRAKEILGRNLECSNKTAPDTNTDKIAAWLDKDPENNKKILIEDMKLMDVINVPISNILTCSDFVDHRKKIAARRAS